MSHLIQMRQRIKAIETIKKITHAMRLISMSTHSRLKHKEEALKTYQATISRLFHTIRANVPEWHNALLHPTHTTPGTSLIILVGSQKGLCGSFNDILFRFFGRHFNASTLNSHAIITVGKRAGDYSVKHSTLPLLKRYDHFASSNLIQITQALTRDIMNTALPYKSVTFVHNTPKTFFLQQPTITQIIPFKTLDGKHATRNEDIPEYIWEQPPTDILDALANQYFESHIYHILFESLLAEQAARFVSMDSSTRNARNLLDVSKLQYNKLRQAKITKELSELVGSY